MASIFCCSSITAYRPQKLDHEQKFDRFMHWAHQQVLAVNKNDDCDASLIKGAPYAVQLVRQANYGPQESIRYFVPGDQDSNFVETTEDALIGANFEKLNSFKNYKCSKHNKFFEVNLYQINPISMHHWRANLARPSRDIDIALKQKAVVADSGNGLETTKENLRSQPDEKTPTLKAHGPPTQACQGDTLPDITMVRAVLRYLLPEVGTSLGSNCILSLLCLNWVNEKLNLDLDLEHHWGESLTSLNIAVFLQDCLQLPESSAADLADMQDLVFSALSRTEPLERDQSRGADRLRNLVKRVLTDRTTDLVAAHKSDIICIVTGGPDEQLLDYCRRKYGNLQKCRNGHKDGEEKNKPWREEDENDRAYYDFDDDHGYSDHEPMKDYTACDKECGYCGECDY